MWKYLLVYIQLGTAWRKLVYTHYPAVYNSHAEEKKIVKKTIEVEKSTLDF